MIGKVDPLIYAITGPMYSAKTRELISHLDKYRYADAKFQLFKPKKDDRYSETDVVTHTKEQSLQSIPVASALEILASMSPDTQVIGIDEAQFFDSEITDVLRYAEHFKLCTSYGKTENFTRDPKSLRNAQPQYKTFTGFEQDLASIQQYEELPQSLKESINYLEKYTGANVRIVSTGPEQSQTIIK